MTAINLAAAIAINDLADYLLGPHSARVPVTDDKARSALLLLAQAAHDKLGAGISVAEVNARWLSRQPAAFGPWRPVSELAIVPGDTWVLAELVGPLGRAVAYIRADMVGTRDWPCVSRFALEVMPPDIDRQILGFVAGSEAPTASEGADHGA